ncbi:CHAT domain-containing protein [Sphaerisporangium siamense]|nr:CHAT domain-containing protein [Sphaerisporangium siamense]
MLDPSALAEAEALFAATTQVYDLPATCHAAGTLHWRRAQSLADERAAREVDIAVPLFMMVHRSGSALPPPEPLAPTLAAIPQVLPGEPLTWMHFLEVLETWLTSGADPYRLRLAVHVGRNAARSTPAGHPMRIGHLIFLSNALRCLFEQSGDLASLDEAIEIGEQGAAEARTDEDRAAFLSGLATSLRVRYEHTGDVPALHRSVETGRWALRVVPHGHPQRYVPLMELSLALRALYDRTDDPALLEELCVLGAAAIEALPPELPPSAVMLTNHGSALRARFERTGRQDVLGEAIAVARRAAAQAPPRTPLQVACRYNLAGLLREQFEHTGDLRALNEAVVLADVVVDATPPVHPDAPLYRSSLAAWLVARFQRSGDLGTLDEAIALGRTAVETLSEDHPLWTQSATNLAVALTAMAGRTGDAGLLDETIALHRRSARNASGRFLAGAVTGLANALLASYELTGDTAALREAIAQGRTALAALSGDDPTRAICAVNLSRALDELTEATGDDRAAEEALGLLEAAAGQERARTSVRVEAARGWGRLAAGRGETERAARGLAAAVELLPRLAARGLSRSDATHWMAEYARLAGDAAALAVETGRPERAVELLEAGRGVLLSQALDARTDLTELRERDAALADRFAYLVTRLDADETGDPSDSPDLRRELAGELAELIERVRSLPGLDRFLLPPDLARLRAEASDGPVVMVNVSDHRCDALILTSSGVQVQELPGLSTRAVHERLAVMREALALRSGAEPERERAERAMHATLAWLWDAVAGPVLDRLGLTGAADELTDAAGGERRLWWVPCGPMAYFPLHAAGHHEDPPGPGRRTVMDRVVSSYTTTVRALAHARARRAERPGPRRPRVLAVAMPETPGAAPLPGARVEYSRLSRLFPGLDGLVGPDATRDAVLSRLPRSAWAHFACHAAADPADPSGSHLLVHDHAGRPLDVVEVSRLRLRDAEFAYLSACDTAVTAPELADECVHVVSAFQLAGFSHVVGTLWEIGDAAAAQLAVKVYEDLVAAGSDPAHAARCLHRATRALRDRHPGMPTLWASHVHMGA